MTTLRFAQGALEALRSLLLKSEPDEAAAAVLANRVDSGRETVLIADDVAVVPREWCTARPLRIDIAPEFTARVLKRARDNDQSLFFVHTHPFAREAMFSSQDDAADRILMPTLFQRAHRGPHGSILLSQEDVVARAYYGAEEAAAPCRLVDAGARIRVWSGKGDNADIPNEFDRNVRAFGEAGQRVLRQLRIGIVGLGGLGSHVAEQAAHLGIRDFVLIDPDLVETTNLNRVVGASANDVGLPKVEVAQRLIARIRADASIEAIPGDVRVRADARTLVSCDVIFSCTDTHGSRAILNQFAHQYYVPVIDAGVRIDAANGKITSITGRVQELAPGLPCLVCERLLDPEQVRRDLLGDEERKADPYIVGSTEPQPSVISLNGVIASFAVTMLLSATCGVPPETRHQLYLADRGIVRAVASQPVPTCPICSVEGPRGRGDRMPMPWRPQL